MKTICITGLDGSGKSTQVKLLNNKLKNSNIVSVWDLISKPTYKEWSIYKQNLDVEKYVMNLSPTSRSLFIFHSFNEAYERAILSNADYLIFDGYWYKYWAIEKAMGCSLDLSFFIENHYAEPDYIFYLDIDIKELKTRKSNISFYESGSKDNISFYNFLKIQEKSKSIINSFLPKKTITIQAELSIEFISKKIYNTIKK